MQFQQKCPSCGFRLNAAFGIVGTTQIASPPKECPKCHTKKMEKVADGWDPDLPVDGQRVLTEPSKEYGKEHPWPEFDWWHEQYHATKLIQWPCTHPIRCMWAYTRSTKFIFAEEGLTRQEVNLVPDDQQRKLDELNREIQSTRRLWEKDKERLQNAQDQAAENLRMRLAAEDKVKDLDRKLTALREAHENIKEVNVKVRNKIRDLQNEFTVTGAYLDEVIDTYQFELA